MYSLKECAPRYSVRVNLTTSCYQAAPTCSDGEIDDPESRDPDHVYWIDEEDSGYELFTPTSRALASTLTVAGDVFYLLLNEHFQS